MILIRAGRVLGPAEGLDIEADVVLDGDRIAGIFPADQGGAEGAPGFSTRERQYEQIIEAEGLAAAPGLVDVHVHFRDPGPTYKEDIHTGARAAAKGGFTTVVCMANTNPIVDNEETLRYVLEEGKKTGIHVLSCAAVSKGFAGRELTDMEGLLEAGAAGFTDDGIPLMEGTFVREAMEEAARLDTVLSFQEEDKHFIREKGINHGRSSGHSVEMVRLAKKLGAKVWAEVTPHHFTLTEEAVLKHGTLAKMNPPLRTEKDRQMLIEGLKDGTIDMIATDHAPHSREEKDRPLTQAPSGILGLETALALGITNLVKPGHLTLLELMEKMSYNPARLYKLDCGRMEAGAPADLVRFDADRQWTVEGFESKSSNSPFLGATLTGKVMYTVCKGRIVYGDQGTEV